METKILKYTFTNYNYDVGVAMGVITGALLDSGDKVPVG